MHCTICFLLNKILRPELHPRSWTSLCSNFVSRLVQNNLIRCASLLLSWEPQALFQARYHRLLAWTAPYQANNFAKVRLFPWPLDTFYPPKNDDQTTWDEQSNSYKYGDSEAVSTPEISRVECVQSLANPLHPGISLGWLYDARLQVSFLFLASLSFDGDLNYTWPDVFLHHKCFAKARVLICCHCTGDYSSPT